MYGVHLLAQSIYIVLLYLCFCISVLLLTAIEILCELLCVYLTLHSKELS